MLTDFAETIALGEGDFALLDLLQGGRDIAVYERLLQRVHGERDDRERDENGGNSDVKTGFVALPCTSFQISLVRSEWGAAGLGNAGGIRRISCANCRFFIFGDFPCEKPIFGPHYSTGSPQMSDYLIGHLGRNSRKNRGCGKPVGSPYPQIRWRWYQVPLLTRPKGWVKNVWDQSSHLFLFLLPPLPLIERSCIFFVTLGRIYLIFLP